MGFHVSLGECIYQLSSGPSSRVQAKSLLGIYGAYREDGQKSKLLKGVTTSEFYKGLLEGLTKGDTRSLDYGSYGLDDLQGVLGIRPGLQGSVI